jgi:neutral amino acid transport system permease protein
VRSRAPADSVWLPPQSGEESGAIEAGTAIERHDAPVGRRVGDLLARSPRLTALGVLLVIFLILVAAKGLHDVAQTGLNGLSLGAIYALGAVGLTLVYGILKLVNFAHGDFLTFGAYMAYLVNVTWGAPLVVAVFWAMLMTALLGILFERLLWGPMRAKHAGFLQLILMSIGLAFVLRAVVQWFWSTEIRILDVNTTSTVELLGLRIGRTELIVVIVGLVVLVAVGLILRYTLLGKRMRALSDDLDLAETAGIDTRRVILYTWVFAGTLAGLAGVLAAAITSLYPELGFELLLPIFAAVILGGIGDAFGALAAGVVLGVMTEWSTLLIDARWKTAVGFLVLLIVLIVRPQGIFGKAKAI